MFDLRNVAIFVFGSLIVSGCVPQLESGALKPIAPPIARHQTPVVHTEPEADPAAETSTATSPFYLPGKSMQLVNANVSATTDPTLSRVPDDTLKSVAREVCPRVEAHDESLGDGNASKRDDFCALYAD